MSLPGLGQSVEQTLEQPAAAVLAGNLPANFPWDLAHPPSSLAICNASTQHTTASALFVPGCLVPFRGSAASTLPNWKSNPARTVRVAGTLE